MKPPNAKARRRQAEKVHTLFDPPSTNPGENWPRWRTSLNQLIFRADSGGGSAFDWTLLVLIGLSVLVVMLDSVDPIHAHYGQLLKWSEWGLRSCSPLSMSCACWW